MRQNTMLIVPNDDFSVDMDTPLEDATILYQWGTKKARRYFCKRCGIMPWYHPRSNPENAAITISCVDWTKGGTVIAPKIKVEEFDGIHYDESLRKLNERDTK